jgi:hypothetical protein
VSTTADPARQPLPKSEWHWLCRFGPGHKYKVRFWGALRTTEYPTCRRCGFYPDWRR